MYFDTNTTPVAGGEQGHGPEAPSDVIEYKEGGNRSSARGSDARNTNRSRSSAASRTITDFEDWANAAQVLDKGAPSRRSRSCASRCASSFSTKQDSRSINTSLHRCWVSEYPGACRDLDAGSNAVALEHIKIENEGWEHDLTLQEPVEA